MDTSGQEEGERKTKEEMERQAGRRSQNWVDEEGIGQRELAVVGEAICLQWPEWLIMIITIIIILH